jgi:hypothetical protein
LLAHTAEQRMHRLRVKLPTRHNIETPNEKQVDEITPVEAII